MHCLSRLSNRRSLSLSRLSYQFCSSESPYKKKKILSDDINTENLENVDDANVTSEKKKKPENEKKKKRIKHEFIDYSSIQSEQSKFQSYLHNNVGPQNIINRLVILHKHNPESIDRVMKTFSIVNWMTGIPFFLLAWHFHSHIMLADLMVSYIMVRFLTAYNPPGSLMNVKLAEFYQAKYPLLKQCMFSRKLMYPHAQTYESHMDIITTKSPLALSLKTFNERIPIVRKLTGYVSKNFYSYPAKYGFSWDLADNTRVLMLMPLFTALCHYGGFGDAVFVFTDFCNSPLAPTLAKWGCIYIGAAYGARISANFSMRAVALTMVEKQFGLRSQDGEYYGDLSTLSTTKEAEASKDATHARPANKKLSNKPK